MVAGEIFAQRYNAIKGGWLQCQFAYDDIQYNTSTYLVTLHLYGKAEGIKLHCWDAVTGASIKNLDTTDFKPYGDTRTNQFSLCNISDSLNNPYAIVYKDINVTLPTNPNGYFLTMSFIGRDSNIVNIHDAKSTGILLSTHILGTINGIDYHKNAAAIFQSIDTVTLCRKSNFSFPIQVLDNDGDSLSYRFGDGINSPFDTTSPPLFPVQYIFPFSGAEPMGSGVTIDPVTGVISGTAPDLPGGYLIAVYVDEWKKGNLINTVRKESMIKVVSCPFQKPLLKPLFSSCRNYTFNFFNEPTCPDITSWFWDFGIENADTDTSSLTTPSFTYPTAPGTYTLKLKVANNIGYIDSATSVVKIFDSITVSIKQDTAVCKTDSITLRPVTDATNFVWRESGGGNTLNSYRIKNPKASPVNDTTTYFLSTRLDGCLDSARIIVYASPYPKVDVGKDTVICLGERTTLQATATAHIFTWSPTNSLLYSNTLQPIASPARTTTYTLSVRDSLYCPKVIKDLVVVKVLPAFTVDAGKDDYVVFGQRYQFNGKAVGNTEIVEYTWQPASAFLNNRVPNAITVIGNIVTGDIPFTLTATSIVGKCSATDEVVLKVFSIAPDIIIPTAFTPNDDGKNDVLKAIPIGMQTMDHFTVYNRYGQAIFTTTEKGKGWDGTIKGVLQNGGAYVVVAKGKDHTGKVIVKKGTTTLIR